MNTASFNARLDEIDAKVHDLNNQLRVPQEIDLEAIPEIRIPQFGLDAETKQKIEEMAGSLDNYLENFATVKEGLGQQLALLEKSTGDFKEALDEMPEKVVAKLNESQGSIESEFDSFTELIADRIDTTIEELDGSTAELAGELRACLEEQFDELMQSVFGDSKMQIENSFKEISEFTSDLANDFESRFKHSIEDLIYHLEDEIEGAIQAAGEEVVATIADTVINECMQSFTITQLSVQVTMVIQPYLPQLAVANAVAPAVQSGLDALRMGT